MMYILLFLLSFFLTYFIREFALKKAILDIPNERSSHTIPTPRGGGLAIVITFFVGLFLFKEQIDSKLFMALFSALPIVGIGLIDDIKPLSFKIRLMVQAFAVLLALYFLGGVNSIDFTWFTVNGWGLNIVAFFAMLWLINLYNFLDGIDGYAASQTIMIGIGMTLLLSNSLGLLLIVASLGFLLFNWHKATIFMGDVGSTTLGFIVAVLIFWDSSNGNIYFWLISLSLFWFDATLTLIRRYRNGEHITQAHKKHAYQRLVQSGWNHAEVTLGLILFNILFIALLYYIKNWEIVFLLNLLILYFIIKYIDTQKGLN